MMNRDRWIILALLLAMPIAAGAYQVLDPLSAAKNLSDVASSSTARANLGANNATNLTTGTIPNARIGPPAQRTVTGTTDTLSSTDCNNAVLYTSSSAVTVTLPNSLAVMCSVALIQGNTGKVSPVAASGATLHSPHSFTGTYAEYSVIGVSVNTNSGTNAAWLLTGDGA